MPKGEGYWLPKSIYRPKYICLWEMPDGRYVGDKDGNFLVSESLTNGDPLVEQKMQTAVKGYGIEGGKPIWQFGRKITAMEADDQMERTLEGKVPDELDEALIEVEEDYLRSRGIFKDTDS